MRSFSFYLGVQIFVRFLLLRRSFEDRGNDVLLTSVRREEDREGSRREEGEGKEEGAEQDKGERQGEGRREKGERRREKGEGKREKGEGRKNLPWYSKAKLNFGTQTSNCIFESPSSIIRISTRKLKKECTPN